VLLAQNRNRFNAKTQRLKESTQRKHAREKDLPFAALLVFLGVFALRFLLFDRKDQKPNLTTQS